MIYAYLVFWLPALILSGLIASDFMDKRRFFKKAKKTTGKVVGTVGAKYKRASSAVNTVVNTMVPIAGISDKGDGHNAGGSLLLVEYEVENGDIYQGRSKQSFNQIASEEIDVFYNPEKPSEIAVDGFYSDKSYIGRALAIAILIITPIIMHIFLPSIE